MSEKRTVRYAIFGGGLAALLVILGCQQAPSPEQLAKKALQAATPAEQELAAVELARVANNDELSPQLQKEASKQLQRVLAESQTLSVRTACIQGLASRWDYDSMPTFLDALDDESDLIRSHAALTIERMMSVDLNGFGYRYDDPPEKRNPAIKRIRQDWEQKRDSPVFVKWRERLKEKQS